MGCCTVRVRWCGLILKGARSWVQLSQIAWRGLAIAALEVLGEAVGPDSLGGLMEKRTT